MTGSRAFVAAGGLLVAAALLHIGALLAGPGAMAAIGAPPSVIMSAAVGTALAPVSTLAIAAGLLDLALCCFSAAGRTPPVPGVRLVLYPAAALFLARGGLLLPFLAGQRSWSTPIGRLIVSGRFFAAGSVVVLAIGGLIAFALIASARQAREANGTA